MTSTRTHVVLISTDNLKERKMSVDDLRERKVSLEDSNWQTNGLEPPPSKKIRISSNGSSREDDMPEGVAALNGRKAFVA